MPDIWKTIILIRLQIISLTSISKHNGIWALKSYKMNKKVTFINIEETWLCTSMVLNTSAVVITFWNGHSKNSDTATTHLKSFIRRWPTTTTKMLSETLQEDHTFIWTWEPVCPRLHKKLFSNFLMITAQKHVKTSDSYAVALKTKNSKEIRKLDTQTPCSIESWKASLFKVATSAK